MSGVKRLVRVHYLSNYRASIIAVHGLGSDPETTWLSDASTPKGNPHMWLRDGLPKDLRARVLGYWHDSEWLWNALSKDLHAHGEDLLLLKIRQVRETKEQQARPLVLLGHSFGGLIIKQVSERTVTRSLRDHR